MNDMFSVDGGEGSIVWVCWEFCLTSDRPSVASVGSKMADMREVIYESVCLLFI